MTYNTTEITYINLLYAKKKNHLDGYVLESSVQERSLSNVIIIKYFTKFFVRRYYRDGRLSALL